ncbi:MAG: DUF2267 domain-containing protein [Cytophagaceae bacterium]
MLFNYQEHIQKAQEFLMEVAVELGMPDDHAHAGRVLAAVLHGLRDVITPQESLHLISQLPLYIQGVYVHGWHIPEKPKRLKTLNDFLMNIKEQARLTAGRDFGDIDNTQKEVEAVFRVIARHVSEGEIKDVKAQLPEEIANLIEV